MRAATKLTVSILGGFIGALILFQIGLAAEPAYLVEYPIPGRPLNVAVEGPNKVWFTMPDADAIGFLDATDSDNPQYIQHNLPLGSEPHDIVYQGGYVWFTEKGSGRIGRINVGDGQLDHFTPPTADGGPTGIDISPSGVVWFLQQDANNVVQYDPVTETFDENTYIFSNGGLSDIVVENDDTIWFTVRNRDEVARYRPSNDQFMPLTTRPPGSTIAFAEPLGITIDQLGTFWVTSFADSYIGRYGRGTLAFFRWTPTPKPSSGPAQIAFYNAGARWRLFYSEYNTGRVSMLTAQTNSAVVGTVSHRLSSANAQPWGVDVDANGCAWFALSGVDALAEWCAPYTQKIRLPIVRAE